MTAPREVIAMPVERLLELFHRVRAGADPDMLLAEIYANAGHHKSVHDLADTWEPPR